MENLWLEVFGDYWHSDSFLRKRKNWKATEFGRSAIYSQYGFKTLILWENEINRLSDNEIVERIENFMEEK